MLAGHSAAKQGNVLVNGFNRDSRETVLTGIAGNTLSLLIFHVNGLTGKSPVNGLTGNPLLTVNRGLPVNVCSQGKCLVKTLTGIFLVNALTRKSVVNDRYLKR